ncbi:MAG: hypothetical protein RIR26_2158, partial [Pseudomonadota bacterium]
MSDRYSLRSGRLSFTRCAAPAGLAFCCASRGPERSRVRPFWLRRSFLSEPFRCRESTRPKTHHTLRHAQHRNGAALTRHDTQELLVAYEQLERRFVRL